MQTFKVGDYVLGSCALVHRVVKPLVGNACVMTVECGSALNLNTWFSDALSLIPRPPAYREHSEVRVIGLPRSFTIHSVLYVNGNYMYSLEYTSEYGWITVAEDQVYSPCK